MNKSKSYENEAFQTSDNDSLASLSKNETEKNLPVQNNNDKKLYEKQAHVLNNLLGNGVYNKNNLYSTENEANIEIVAENDPEIIDTVENYYLDSKLKKERDHKKKSRELRSANYSNLKNKTDEAIEKIENSMEDYDRSNKLLTINETLEYLTKPKLKDQIKETKDNYFLTSNAKSTITSYSKYDDIKPKIQTRIEQVYSNLSLDNLHFNFDDVNLANSNDIREISYKEWLFKKKKIYREKSKEISSIKKNEEEKKAKEMMDKLNKSQAVLRIWYDSKLEQSKKLQKAHAENENQEKKQKEKIKEAEIAFKEWLRKKNEQNAEKLADQLNEKRNAQRCSRSEKEAANEFKPPLPFEVWAKRKIEETKAKNKLLKETSQVDSQNQKNIKKKLAEQSYSEWLNRKEHEKILKKYSTSRSESPVPFYPASAKVFSGY
jgi:hypothetical protein